MRVSLILCDGRGAGGPHQGIGLVIHDLQEDPSSFWLRTSIDWIDESGNVHPSGPWIWPCWPCWRGEHFELFLFPTEYEIPWGGEIQLSDLQPWHWNNGLQIRSVNAPPLDLKSVVECALLGATWNSEKMCYNVPNGFSWAHEI